MDFEEMQLIWNNQNGEQQYTINEQMLHKLILQKGKSVNWMLILSEWMMIFMNLVVGIFLLIDTIRDQDSYMLYLLPILYILFSLFSITRPFKRRQQERAFPNSMLGDLDKAIWRLEYLMAQGREMMRWYIWPLIIVFLITMIYQGKWVWGISFGIIMFVVSHYGMRWEARKWHIPKKEMLQSLRKKLTTD